MSIRRLALAAVLILLLAAIVWRWRGGADPAPRRPPPVRVELTTVRSGAAPVLISAMGNVISPHSIRLRAQVSGTLKEIYFREGDSVSAGQKLFLIDPAPYQAALAQARAQLAIDRASLAAARAQYERMKPLIDREYVTSQEYDNAHAAADEGAARMAADQAAVQTAEINLSYTLVRAPIAGRTGSVGAKTGNLVGSNDATPLVVLNQIDPVQVQFAIPQNQLPAVQQALARGALPVQIDADDPPRPLAEGRLIFVENAVDTGTGTVTLRAEASNAAHTLWPGAFVAVRLQLAIEPDAVLVPETAVQSGADGPFVFVVGDDHKATLRTLAVDRQLGADLVVRGGLAPGETVIARVPHNLQPGTVVTAVEPSSARPAAGRAP